jgi:hypothetical protein
MSTFTAPISSSSGKSHFGWLPAIVAFIVLEALVALQAGFAYRDHFLTVAQMNGRGINFGLPFVWHFGMWGDAFIVSPLAAYLTGRFSSNWRMRRLLVSLAIGVAISVVMSWSYTLPDFQEAHVQNHSLTWAGVVHGAYMALALAIFVQFFFFTQNISPTLLRMAGVLLVFHVFLGTHMALGLLQLVIPLEWYPAKPLTSVIGWSVIASVAGILVWRNVGNAGLYRAAVELYNLIVLAIILVYLFLTAEDLRPIEGYLKFLNRISDLSIAITYFFQLFKEDADAGGDRLSLALLLMIAIKYFFSRVSVTQELAIGPTLYPPDRVPDNVRQGTRFGITIRVLGFLALYAVLGIVSDHIFWASLILTIIALNDYLTRGDISLNILRTFDDPQYMPSKDERGYQAILDRRQVARWYLSELPTRTKEGLCATGCAVSCGIAIYGFFSGAKVDFIAYAILIGTLALNELVTLGWRIVRFRRLLAIDARALPPGTS